MKAIEVPITLNYDHTKVVGHLKISQATAELLANGCLAPEIKVNEMDDKGNILDCEIISFSFVNDKSYCAYVQANQ